MITLFYWDFDRYTHNLSTINRFVIYRVQNEINVISSPVGYVLSIFMILSGAILSDHMLHLIVCFSTCTKVENIEYDLTNKCTEHILKRNKRMWKTWEEQKSCNICIHYMPNICQLNLIYFIRPPAKQPSSLPWGRGMPSQVNST